MKSEFMKSKIMKNEFMKNEFMKKIADSLRGLQFRLHAGYSMHRVLRACTRAQRSPIVCAQFTLLCMYAKQ